MTRVFILVDGENWMRKSRIGSSTIHWGIEVRKWVYVCKAHLSIFALFIVRFDTVLLCAHYTPHVYATCINITLNCSECSLIRMIQRSICKHLQTCFKSNKLSLKFHFIQKLFCPLFYLVSLVPLSLSLLLNPSIFFFFFQDKNELFSFQSRDTIFLIH